jgi:hypothetical protein
MSDGYGNAHVHKFSKDLKLVKSWGEPGNGPGQFNLPHGLWIDRRGRLLVADRENDRVQVFLRRTTQTEDEFNVFRRDSVQRGISDINSDRHCSASSGLASRVTDHSMNV